MADNSKEEFLQLIKRAGTFLSVKISNLFRHLDSRSFGAVAGLAFAIVFTWRLLRTPRGPQRRQSKRQAPSASSSGVSSPGASAGSSEVGNPSEDCRTQTDIDEFFQPVKPTLSQIVRQRLSEGRKVTCRLLGVILEESSPEELQKQATVRSSALEVLLEITKFCDLYLMESVLDDESENYEAVHVRAGIEKEQCTNQLVAFILCIKIIHYVHGDKVKDPTEALRRLVFSDKRGTMFLDSNPYDISYMLSLSMQKRVLAALEDAGVFTSSGLVKDKVLFCSTENGRTSFVRQLEPDWHIDSNPEIINQLSRFIRYQLHVSPIRLDRPTSNIFAATSLEQFFGCM